MTVRIDTLRNTVAATVRLLEQVGEELDDLHLLAYDRKVAAEEAHVAGGSRDYALDTHGDPKAREAYRLLGEQTVQACGWLADAAHRANRVLTAGDDGPLRKGKRTVTAIELAEAIAAQGRRIADGTFVPVRRRPQPDTSLAWNKLVKSKDAAEAEAARLRRKVADLEAELDERRSA